MKYREILPSNEGVQYHLTNNLPLHESVFRMGSDEYFRMFSDARKMYNEGKLKDLHWFDEEILRDTLLGEWTETRWGKVPLDMIIDEENHTAFIEGTLTKAQIKKRDKLADKMPDKEFKKRYGDDWEAVKYGAATNIVKGESIEEAEYRGKTVDLNKPKRGGSKKFYVYTKNPKTDNVVKVEFGAEGGGGNLAVKLKDPKAKASFASRHDCENKKDKTKAGYWSCRLPRYAKSLGLSGGGTWW